MSQPPSEPNVSSASADKRSGQHREALVDRVLPESALTPVRTAGFWVAVTLPFLYLPLLATGLDAQVEVVVFLSLLAVNVLALLVGHSHHN